ncbi:helix-turn-helix domain-containing protein [Tomitella gaofuii]|uniref:helix-turn-helix domain-containing protein n=1 Tax=Tomitella gaofuii TaxID=2760083 RepID=UPI0015FA8A0D|nr:helix-turn-helix domain-containing protein [Tomitella gaofuii]
MSAVVDRGVGKTTLTVTPEQMAQAEAVDPEGLQSLVPAELARILSTVVQIVADGGTVTIGAMPEELTTTSAADLLGVSRPTLMKLIREGRIPAHKVGTHTRLGASDVLAFRDRKREQQRAALQDLRDFEESEGLEY